jgi:hypothetical protein
MGFYYGRARGGPWSEDVRPLITPREYATLLARAMRMVTSRTPPESDTYCSPAALLSATSGLVEGLSRQVRRHPGDPATHRRLGIAHLYAGDCKPAVRHLQIAVNILLAQSTAGGSLRQTLCARLELALLLPVLLPLCLRLGKHETARRLVSDVLLAR